MLLTLTWIAHDVFEEVVLGPTVPKNNDKIIVSFLFRNSNLHYFPKKIIFRWPFICFINNNFRRKMVLFWRTIIIFVFWFETNKQKQKIPNIPLNDLQAEYQAKHCEHHGFLHDGIRTILKNKWKNSSSAFCLHFQMHIILTKK